MPLVIRMFEKFKMWLDGQFICKKCKKTVYSLGTFGFGEIICPSCFNGEKEFLFLDKSYWLNRFISKLVN